MNILVALLILAADPGTSTGGRYPEATQVFHTSFGEAADTDFDTWPDGWRRRQGAGYPHYVKIEIESAHPPGGGRALRIALDGGAGVAYSPPVAVIPFFDFVLEGYLRTEGLQYDRAWLSLTMLDEQERPLETFQSEKALAPGDWRRIRLGPVSPASGRERFAVIGLHLEPGRSADLKGSARFADIWLGRVPRMVLSTEPAQRVLAHPAQVTITCTASGLSPSGTTVGFELADVYGKRIAGTDQRFRLQPREKEPDPIRRSPTAPAASTGLVGTAQWTPQVPGPGFYRLRATMPAESGVIHRRELTLAVVEPQRAAPGGEFGWSLPGADHPLPWAVQSRMAVEAGVSWVKYPLWFGSKSTEGQAEAFDFLDQFSSQGIEIVGVLRRPPDEVRGKLEGSKRSAAADVFSLSPEVWSPSIEATMARFGARVRWWQLGDDRDTSFTAFPDMGETVGRVKAQLDRIGRDVRLAMGWNAIYPLPELAESARPWRAVCLSAEPALTDRELPAYLAAARQPGLRRWLVLDPLPSAQYSIEDRAADLVRRIVAAKAAGAEGMFIADPFNRQRGLIGEDGGPGELFLPWRTAALALGAAVPVGSMPLPGGSTNYVFARGQEAVMVAWNGRRVLEEVFLGEGTRALDPWGRAVGGSRPVRVANGFAEGASLRGSESGKDAAFAERKATMECAAIPVGPVPTIVTGVNAAVARWQIDFSLAQDRFPSITDRRHANRLTLKNTFDQGAEGSVELIVPDDWTVQPRRFRFRLAAGETLQQPFEITLPVSVGSGDYVLRADFAFTAGRPYRFSASRKLRVGLDDVCVEVSTQLNRAGELEVAQRLVNRTDRPVNFRCHLYAPDRRRLSSQVMGLGPGDDVRVYRLPEGKQLIGRTLWLQAEEVDGPRVLNRRFVAEE